MADCNIRNVPEEVMRGAKRAALEGGKTLREWVIGVMSGALGSGWVKPEKVKLESLRVAEAVQEEAVAVMEGEGVGKACAKHGDKWCMECEGRTQEEKQWQ